MPNRFSSVSDHHKYISETSFQLNQTINNNNETTNAKKNIITIVLPDLDIKKYFYSKKTVKQIKIVFHQFYDSRADCIASEKRSQRIERSQRLSQSIDKSTYNMFKPSHRFRQSADNYRQRIFEQVEQENEKEESKFINTGKGRKISLEEAYAILKKKKQNEIAIRKMEQEKEEMKQCTFHPNIIDKDKDKTQTSPTGTNIKETINKLYIDGFTKQRARNAELKRIDGLSDECTFLPKVNKVNSSLFDVNPLIHDELIKKEVERFERARVEKKIQELQKKKGINNLKMFKNLDVLLKEEDLPNWNFSIERKCHKESIDTQYKKQNITHC